MELVVDVQSFCENENKLIIKECAVVAVGFPYIQHWIVKSPHDFHDLNTSKRKAASWVKSSHLGIGWNEGGVYFSQFVKELEIACSRARKIYVKGTAKADFISRLIDTEVVELTDHCAPPLSQLMQDSNASLLRCLRHSDNTEYVCALTTADKLRYWITSNSHLFMS